MRAVTLAAVTSVALAGFAGAAGVAEAKYPDHWRTHNKVCHTHKAKRHGRHVRHCVRVQRQHGGFVQKRTVKVTKRNALRVGAWRNVRQLPTRYVLPASVVACESGGNPRAVNYSNPNRPAGLYQIITSTWLGYGGGRFAPTADRATPFEQGVIALRILHGQGAGAWECWR
jgi:Transglycosylase-like domain